MQPRHCIDSVWWSLKIFCTYPYDLNLIVIAENLEKNWYVFHCETIPSLNQKKYVPCFSNFSKFDGSALLEDFQLHTTSILFITLKPLHANQTRNHSIIYLNLIYLYYLYSCLPPCSGTLSRGHVNTCNNNNNNNNHGWSTNPIFLFRKLQWGVQFAIFLLPQRSSFIVLSSATWSSICKRWI